MISKLKIKVKIKGDKKSYILTKFKEGIDIECYDPKTGVHIDFDWDMIEKFSDCYIIKDNTSTKK